MKFFIRPKAVSPLRSATAVQMKPKADAFHRIEQFPSLGTGKLDLRGAKEMAAKFAA